MLEAARFTEQVNRAECLQVPTAIREHPSLAACKTSGAHTCIQALRQLRAGFSNEQAGQWETVRLCRDLINPGAFNANVHASSPIIFMILMDLDGVALHHPLRRPRREHMCRFEPLDTRLGGGVLAGALSRVSVPGLLGRRLPLHWVVPHDARTLMLERPAVFMEHGARR